MATRQRKAEKRRLKRQKHAREKQVMALRYQRRLSGDAYPIHACLANRHWREDGIASILFTREVGPGRVTLAAFLVDIWAMGLKDAWGRVDIGASEVDDMVKAKTKNLEIRPLNVGTARHLVYGGIQLARELGFRLPRRYERWTAILGPLPEGETPDMSLFLVNGKIRLTCPRWDFEARLVGSSPEEFLARPDVEFILGEGDFTLVDDEADEAADVVTDVEEALLQRVQQWCFANGQVPHPLLSDAVGALLESSLQGVAEECDGELDAESLDDDQVEKLAQQTDSFLGASLLQDPRGMQVALDQLGGFMQTLSSPQELAEALGFDADDEPPLILPP